jgi:hypothetical protein
MILSAAREKITANDIIGRRDGLNKGFHTGRQRRGGLLFDNSVDRKSCILFVEMNP